MKVSQEYATKATGLQLAQWAERNLFSFSHQANRELARTADHDSEIAIAHVGIALCRARRILVEAITQLEAR